MKKLTKPITHDGWRRLVSSIIRANLKLAEMDYVDLSAAFKSIGEDEESKNISAKLQRGTFSAVFFLQALSLIGVDQLAMPVADDHGEGDCL